MVNRIFIDPGESGGLAWHDHDGIVQAEAMPEGMTEQIDLIRRLTVFRNNVVMEKTGSYMPGNSGPAAAKFARHCGHLEAALYTLGVPVTQVAPNVWQRKLGTLPKEKTARKKAIKEVVQRQYPHLDVTLKTADALGMLYAYRGE